MSNWEWIVPYKLRNEDCLSIGHAPSQGLVYSITENIVVKVAYQYLIPKTFDDEAEFRQDCGLRSFKALRKEIAIYGVLRRNPHQNFARSIPLSHPDTLFLERLNPLATAWPQHVADRDTHLSWIRQLMDAVTWLEKLGYTHGDLAVQNLAVDQGLILKMFDFGSASHRDESWFQQARDRDHAGLATCLHFILSGIDPLAGALGAEDARRLRQSLRNGTREIDPQASVLKELIRDGWMERRKGISFWHAKMEVGSILGSGQDCAGFHESKKVPLSGNALKEECLEWINAIGHEPQWMAEEDYRRAWKDAGFESVTEFL